MAKFLLNNRINEALSKDYRAALSNGTNEGSFLIFEVPQIDGIIRPQDLHGGTKNDLGS